MNYSLYFHHFHLEKITEVNFKYKNTLYKISNKGIIRTSMSAFPCIIFEQHSIAPLIIPFSVSYYILLIDGATRCEHYLLYTTCWNTSPSIERWTSLQLHVRSRSGDQSMFPLWWVLQLYSYLK